MAAMSWLTAAASLLLGLFGEWRYRRLPELQRRQPAGPLPSLSVIVPARNEAANLPRLLDSLQSSTYPGPCEVIVVDDASHDGTGSLARGYGVRVVRLEELTAGWLGKPHACHRGAAVAQGEWLLFTDADTIHHPGAAAEAVRWAITNDVDGLSLFPGHDRGTAADRLLLAVAFAGYFAGLVRTSGLLNGQYILLRRVVYERSGGFAAVRGEPMEDLALGHRLRAQGYLVPVVRGERLVRVRMYTTPRAMWHGFTRLAALSLRWSGPGALLTAVFTFGTAAPLSTLLRSLAGRRGRRRASLLWLVTCVGVAPWVWRLRAMPWIPLAPFGAAFVQAAAIWGITTRIIGLHLRWKGRPI
jgi:chlorobactene glucosyltransferase